jgi:hypothetical protein
MDILFDTYKKNVGLMPLFSLIMDIDFYDGSTEAICKLNNAEKWYVCSLVHINLNPRQRIFTLLELDEQWILKAKPIVEKYQKGDMSSYEAIKREIKLVYDSYKGTVYLFKPDWSDWMDSRNYEIVRIPKESLRYFKDIEDVIEQDKESKLLWMNFFANLNLK